MEKISWAKNIAGKLTWAVLESSGIRRKLIAKLLRRERIKPHEIEVLAAMREANSISPSPYRASPIWTDLAAKFDDWFWSEGIDSVETQQMNRFFSSPRPGDPKLLQYACWLYYQNIKNRDTMNLLAKVPCTIPPASDLSFNFEGTTVSWDLLISVDTVYALADAFPAIISEPVVILDLGAGWGRMGYALKKANPLCTYVVCDLPEALLVSSIYLPRLLPGERVLSFPETRNTSLNALQSPDGGLWFLGTQDLERIPDKSVDYLINIASFQEMTYKQVAEYFAIIDRKVGGVFFTQQLKNSQTHSYNLGEIKSADDYPFREDWTKLFYRDATFSDLYFETAYFIPK